MRTSTMANGVAMTLLFTTLFAAASAWGQNVATGKQIAERWCASCHVVGPGQKNVPNDAVPSFPSIAQMSSTTKMSLAAFLSTSHPPMPDIVLSRSEIADVSAYILSLRKQK